MKKRILSLLLAVVMTVTLLPSAVWAQSPAPEETAETGGSFILLAANTVRVIIAPERVTCQPGQTVRQALAASGHSFIGLDTGYVSSIDGCDGISYRCDEDGDYNMEQPAADVALFAFTAFMVTDPGALYTMAQAMVAWQEAASPVQRFAQAEYDAARSALISGGDFAALAAALSGKIAQYGQYSGAEKLPLKLNIEGVDNAPLTDYTFTAEDPYGNRYTFTQNDTAALAAGSYTFTLTSGCNGAYGSMTVAADGTVSVDGSTVEALRVPQGAAWLAQPVLLRKNGGSPETDAYPMESGTGHSSTALLPDTVGTTGALYLYGVPGADTALSDKQYQWQGHALTLYTRYTDTGGALVEQQRAWKSTSAAVRNAVNPGPEGGALCLEARAEVDGYTLYQTWTVALERTPTLRSLTVTADGIPQSIAFAPQTTDYACTVTADAAVLTPEGFDGGYAVTVNGQPLTGGQYTLPLAEGETTAQIAVTMASGRSKTYTVTFTRVAATAVTVTHESGVSVRIYNEAGAEIGASAAGTYPLTPGGVYTYVATRNVWYHTTGTFTATEGLTVSVPTPVTTDRVTALRLSSGFNWSTSDHFLTDEDFNPATHAYILTVSDVYGKLYAWATAGDGVTLTAQTTPITSGAPNGKLIAGGLTAGPESHTVTLRAAWEAAGVQHYQEYRLTLHKTLTLADVALAIDGGTTDLYPLVDGAVSDFPGFDGEETAYQADIVRSAQEATLTVTVPFADYTVQVNGKDLPAVDGTTSKTTTVTLPLSSDEDAETFTLTARSAAAPAAEATVYTITLQKGDPIATAFTVQDTSGAVIPGALTALYDSRSNTRIWPDEDGTFRLVAGLRYTYVVTCTGYVGVKDTFTAGQDNANMTIALTAAPETTHGAGVSDRWGSFRGNGDNNGVVSVKTPGSRETAALSWATLLGSSYGSKAVSCPILITEDGVDYLIVYSGETLYKVESVTGTVVATGSMHCASSFAINSATYGGGMLFVALKDGTVQAFDAATLESLWLYKDPLGGQPDSPLTYYKGYVYTGFWISETAEASFVCLPATDEDPTSPNEEKLARWSYTSPGGFYWAGAYVCDDYLLVGTDDGDSGYTSPTARLLCIDPATGAVLDTLEGLQGDIRSSIARYDGRFYFTSKGGYFYSVAMSGHSFDRASLKAIPLENGGSGTPMSTCTPVVYNGRAYIGVSGATQFGTYSGHNITVIDLTSWAIAYTVPTMGYPQTSGLLSTGYDDGSVYVYFFENTTPGQLRLLKDKPSQLQAELVTEEAGISAAYSLFTPQDGHGQHCICSPIADQYGTLYFKNDSSHLMALTGTIAKMQVTKRPDKTAYTAGEAFDPTGMEITLTYENGTSRTLPASRVINGTTVRYFTWNDTVTEEDTDFTLTYVPLLYQSDADGEKVPLTATATVPLTVTPADYDKGDINGDGAVDVYDLQRLYEHCSATAPLTGAALTRADLNGDGLANVLDMQALYSFLTTGAWSAPQTPAT